VADGIHQRRKPVVSDDVESFIIFADRSFLFSVAVAFVAFARGVAKVDESAREFD
jgi:hypothetical protein